MGNVRISVSELPQLGAEYSDAGQIPVDAGEIYGRLQKVKADAGIDACAGIDA